MHFHFILLINRIKKKENSLINTSLSGIDCDALAKVLFEDKVEKITGKKVPFYKADILDRAALEEVFAKEKMVVGRADILSSILPMAKPNKVLFIRKLTQK